jgi:predicted nucleic acid-binding protein
VSTFVIDASVAIKWVVDESGTNEALLLRRHRLLAPDLLIPECANILWKKVRRQELSEDLALVCAGILARSDIEFEPMAALMEQATRFSVLLGHAAYDCFYLALAMARDCDFVTADKVLQRKVQSAGLPVKVVMLLGAGPV